jgi:transketolase
LGQLEPRKNENYARGPFKLNYQRDALIDQVYAAAKLDRDIFILSADFGAPALDRFREDLSDQFLHLGISEQNLIDVAIGMSLKGKKVFTYAMAPFISLRCAEQHKICAMMRLPIVNIIAGVGLGYANAGPTHYATEDYSIAVNTIKSSVYTMSDAPQAAGFVDHYLKNPHYCFIRLDRAPGPDLQPESDYNTGFRTLLSGGDVCLITHGYFVGKIYSMLLESGMGENVTLVDLFASKPLPEGLLKMLSSFTKVVFVDEQIASSSLGFFATPQLNSYSPKTIIQNIALDEKFMFENVGRDRLVELAGIDKKKILSAISN